jgi:hypothetical protein
MNQKNIAMTSRPCCAARDARTRLRAVGTFDDTLPFRRSTFRGVARAGSRFSSTRPNHHQETRKMSVQKFAVRALAAASLALAAASACAADTIVWTESTGFVRTYGVAAATPPGAAAQLMWDQTKIKGPNGVEFIDGRIWWTNQQQMLISTGVGIARNRYSIGSSLPDGTDARVISTGSTIPYDVDIQGGTLYWTDQNGGTIWTLNPSLAVPSSSVFLTSGITPEVASPFAIDATAGGVYWSQVGSSSASNRIMRANLDGSNITTLLTGIQSYDFEVVGSQIFYTTTDGFVKRSELDGSNLVTLASGQGFLNGIDVTGDSIYVSVLSGTFEGPGFTTLGAGRIRKMNLDGSGDVELIVGQQNFTSGVVFDPAQIRGVAVLTAPVPEPETYALMLAGIALIAGVVRRRR